MPKFSNLSLETQRHYASMLLAMLNHAVAERVIPSHQLMGVHKARGALAPRLVNYLLSIRPKHARGLIHPNPTTGKHYVDIRKQWARLIEIASRMLGYEFAGKKADFFNFRHTGASHIATRSRDGKHLVAVVRRWAIHPSRL